jgi:cytidylate kinase
MSHTIITIGRQYGSGGREIGQRLAKKLGIPYYDKELIAMAAKKSGIREDLLKEIDERATNSFLYSLVMGVGAFGTRGIGTEDLPINDRLFLIQNDLIHEIASEGPCVIVGRCADYILENKFNCVNVFIHAPMEFRMKRAMEVYGLSKAGLENKINKIDKGRASYYNYYSNRTWGKVDNYHLTFDSSVLGIEKSVDLIAAFAEKKKA